MSNSRYYPVLFVSKDLLKIENLLGKPGRFWTWWDEGETIFKHPGMLLNAFTSKDLPNQRADMEVPKSCQVLADSGGFQIHIALSKGKKVEINQLEILRWQERNGDTAFIIDIPIGAEHDDATYEFGLTETIKNCQFFQDNMVSDELRMLNVLHGHTYDRCVRWYDSLKKFDYRGKTGWSVGFHPSGDVLGQARMIMLLQSLGHKGYLHLLGTSGWNVQPILVYAARFFETLVYDSSSYASGYKERTYNVPPDIDKSEDITFGDKIQSWGSLKHPPCCCHVCRYITDNGIEFATAMTNPQAGGHIISLHNLCLMLDRHRKLEALADDKDRYFKYVQKHCSPAAFMALNYINDCQAMGYQRATEQYQKWMARTVVTQVQAEFGSLFHHPEKAKAQTAIRKEITEPRINPKTGKVRQVRKKPEKGPKVLTSIDISTEVTKLSADQANMIAEEIEPKVESGIPETISMEDGFNQALIPMEELVGLVGDFVAPKEDVSPVVLASEEKRDTLVSELLPTTKPVKTLMQEPVVRKPRKVVQKPALLDLSSVEEVHLEVVVEKPECFGNFDPKICTGEFCQEALGECKDKYVTETKAV